MTGNMSPKEDQRDTASDDACVDEWDMLLSVLDTLNGGLIILDARLRIVAANKLSASLLDVPAKYVNPGAPFSDFVRFAAERGDYGEGDVEAHYERVMDLLKQRKPYEMWRQRPDGIALEINGSPIAGGGYVTRFHDVTAAMKQRSIWLTLPGRANASKDFLNCRRK